MFKVTDKMSLGTLCKNNHSHVNGQSYRYSRSKGSPGTGRCVECQSVDSKREFRREYVKKYSRDNYKALAEKRDDYFKQYRVDNKDRINTRSDKWRKANPDKHCANSNRRRARKLNATPLWANQKYIDIFYQIAKEETIRLGVQCDVDHIVPLKNKWVCGLHNEFNLQVITAEDNRRKSNKFDIYATL